MPISLPLTPPPVTAYLFYLYPLSILAARGDYRPWLYSHFVQLFRQPGGDLKFYLHPQSTTHSIRHAYLTTCPCLDIQSLDQRLVVDGPEGIASFTARCLQQGLYVQVDADLFHLPHRLQYRRLHFLHEVLICGVDAVQRAFQVSGIDDAGRPASAWLSFADLERSVGTPRDDFLSDARANGPPLPAWFRESLSDRPRLFLYRHLPHVRCELDLPLLAEQLDDYLAARCTADRHRLVAPPADTIWGLDVYQHLEEILSDPARCRDALAIPFRVLWEHKTLMVSRARYLRRHTAVEVDGDLIATLEQVAARLHSLRLVLLRWEQSQRGAAPHPCVELLREAREVEREGLSCLLGRVLRAAG